MSARTDLVLYLQSLVGESLRLDSLGTGWPTLATLNIDNEPVQLALFVSSIGRTHRNRDDVERRFQNPASGAALASVDGHESVLLGVWQSDDLLVVERPIVVLADADRREGRPTRWSAFVSVESLIEAVNTGWSSSVNDSNETMYYMAPTLLPVAIVGTVAGTEPNERSIYRAIAAVGIGGEADDLSGFASERVRRTVSSLVRDSRFSGRVLAAYDRACAMCGLSLGLVQGAHIYPASAPGSRDVVANGLALCANHHLAFDRHLIAVEPESLEIFFHPSVMTRTEMDEAVKLFVQGTRSILRPPISNPPDKKSFVDRYEHFSDSYAWFERWHHRA